MCNIGCHDRTEGLAAPHSRRVEAAADRVALRRPSRGQDHLGQDARGRDVSELRLALDAVECKINPDKLNTAPIVTFRQRYPRGENYVATPLVQEPYAIKRGNLTFTICSSHDID